MKPEDYAKVNSDSIVNWYTNLDAIVKSFARPNSLDLRQNLAEQLANLKAWYQDNLVVKERKGDARDSQHNDEYINFRPNYYLLGFNSGVQNQNKRLPQTIGWQDYNNGGSNGTFDPLAE